MNILHLLKSDHDQVKKLLEHLKDTTTRAINTRKGLLEELKDKLVIHEKIEETLFYPPLKKHEKTRDLALEAYEEHHLIDKILSELEKCDPSEDQWAAKFEVLRENLEHHIEEEENELFPKVEKVLPRDDLEDMGKEMQEKKKELAA
jgi:hemerythrin-like domain-containing protein